MDVRADHRKPRVVLAKLLIAALSAAFSVPKPVPAQTVITTIPVGDFPTGVAANPSTNRIYAANESDDTVSVIDGVTNSVVATIGVGNGPLGVNDESRYQSHLRVELPGKHNLRHRRCH